MPHQILVQSTASFLTTVMPVGDSCTCKELEAAIPQQEWDSAEGTSDDWPKNEFAEFEAGSGI